MFDHTPNPTGHICAHCHQEGRGCCFSFNDTSQIFSLLPEEVGRMAIASETDVETFTVRDEITDDFKELLTSLHPALAATVPNNQRLRLRVLDNGHCFFLTDQGCLLPVEARPYYCRLYPFWILPDSRLLILMNNNCLAQKKAADWRQVMARIGVDEKEVRRLFQEYIAAINRSTISS